MSNDILVAAFKRYENFILPIVAVIVAIALFGLFVVPQGLKVPETTKQIQSAQTSLDGLTKKESILESVDPDKVQSDLDTSYQALPQDPDIPGVFGQILLTMTANNLALQDVAVSQTQSQAGNANNLTDYVFKITSTGSPDDFSHFIDQTKQIPRVIKVQAFDTGSGVGAGVIAPVNPQAGGNTVVGLNIDITIQTFYQGVPASQNISTDQPVSLPSDIDEKTLDNIKTEISNLPGGNNSNATVPGGKTDPFQ